MPKLEWAGLVRVFGGVAWPKVEEVVGQALAGSMLVQPASVQDLRSEELRPTIDRFYRGSTGSAEERIKPRPSRSH